MRKLVLSLGLILCFCALNVNAQDAERIKGTTTKSGQQILPQAGDVAIGIDATPLLKYAGNMFNNSDDNSAKDLFNGQDQKIYGKYFINDNNAIRVKLLINLYNETFKNSVTDDVKYDYDTNPFAKTEDEMKIKSSEFELWGGYEWRRGYGRLQGFYGVEAGFGVSSNNVTFDYGNAFTANNQEPSSWDYQTDKEVNMENRPTEYKFGNEFLLGAGGFIGVEYFVAPKMSIGGEFSLSFVYSNVGKHKNSIQRWNDEKGRVETITSEGYYAGYEPNSTAGLRTKTSGNIFMMFYF